MTITEGTTVYFINADDTIDPTPGTVETIETEGPDGDPLDSPHYWIRWSDWDVTEGLDLVAGDDLTTNEGI